MCLLLVVVVNVKVGLVVFVDGFEGAGFHVLVSKICARFLIILSLNAIRFY